ncbi:MAG: hypothetical protein JWL87_288 [Candidatus Adlerbacteria bacterium]|nr:hypothetical protein [Candidatus Adlerbacteria bacterium]
MRFGSIPSFLRYGIAFIAGSALTAGALWFIRDLSEPEIFPLRQSDVNPDHQYRFIDPLLGLRQVNEDTSPDFAALRVKLEDYLKQEQKNGHASAVSVKVRDLQTSTGFTINPDEKYAPASLLKVPTMMAYFKLAESDRSLLVQKITYKGEEDTTRMPMFPPSERLEKGESYSVLELIERMVRLSDNDSLLLLNEHLVSLGRPQAVQSLGRDLGIEDVYVSDDFITIQGYAMFWRVLYNATYLSRDMSENALQILSSTDYAGGIKSGVPKGIAVAQKFGEYGLLEKGSQDILKAEMHDCGIVYLPAHPYLLCVMTKGKDVQELDGIIREISKMAYEDRLQL